MSQIELAPVQSSRLAAIGYSDTEHVLAVRFPPTRKSPAGRVYHYSGFLPEQWKAFREAESLGGYFGKHILNNPEHPCRCVDEGTQEPPPISKNSRDSLSLPSEEAALKSRALEVSRQAEALVICSPQEYAEAGFRLKRLVLEKKQAQQRVNSIKTPAYQTYKAALQLERDVMIPYSQAEQWIKAGMAKYLTEEESDRRRREVSLSLEAHRQAEEEATELAELDALALEAVGEVERAAELRRNPSLVAAARVMPVVLPKEVPKVEGVSSRKNWSYRIVDESLLPREYLMPNEGAIRQVVKALKDKCSIPGVEVYWEDSVSVRA